MLTYEGWLMDKGRGPCHQVWTVRGAAGLGLPNELGDRVVLALISLNFQQDKTSRSVEFSRYQLLKQMGLDPRGSTEYAQLEKTLRQLAGLTIESERAFYEKARNKRLTSKKAFHLFDKLWLKKHESFDDDQGEWSSVSANGYVVWGQEFWSNLQAGYIKNMNLDFYFGLSTPLARRLYRFLDKRMRHQSAMEIDIFELSNRLGQTAYRRPSETFRKLEPSVHELIEQQFLVSVDLIKRSKYTRVRFVRNDDATFAHRRADQLAKAAAVTLLQKQYKTTERHADVWTQALKTLKSQLSAPQYAILADSTLLTLNIRRAVICVPHAFAVQWITEHSDVMLACQAALAAHVENREIALEFVERRVGENVGFTAPSSGDLI